MDAAVLNVMNGGAGVNEADALRVIVKVGIAILHVAVVDESAGSLLLHVGRESAGKTRRGVDERVVGRQAGS